MNETYLEFMLRIKLSNALAENQKLQEKLRDSEVDYAEFKKLEQENEDLKDQLKEARNKAFHYEIVLDDIANEIRNAWEG